MNSLSVASSRIVGWFLIIRVLRRYIAGSQSMNDAVSTSLAASLYLSTLKLNNLLIEHLPGFQHGPSYGTQFRMCP